MFWQWAFQPLEICKTAHTQESQRLPICLSTGSNLVHNSCHLPHSCLQEQEPIWRVFLHAQYKCVSQRVQLCVQDVWIAVCNFGLLCLTLSSNPCSIGMPAQLVLPMKRLKTAESCKTKLFEPVAHSPGEPVRITWCVVLDALKCNVFCSQR